MNTTQMRPGGLTVLAVINFVLGGFGILGILALAAALSHPDMRSALEQELGRPLSDQWIGVMAAISAVEVTLLIVSGVGYLGQKRVMGRVLGSLYGVLGLATNAYEATASGFQLSTIIGLVYPLLTLVLVNGTFKDDLAN